MISCGVSSSKITTASTDASAARTSARSCFGIDRPIGRLAERFHRSIAVDADDQQIAKRARVAKIADVAGMKDVEDAVREDDRLAVSARALDERSRFSRVIASWPQP